MKELKYYEKTILQISSKVILPNGRHIMQIRYFISPLPIFYETFL
jgi:hypothetical protein